MTMRLRALWEALKMVILCWSMTLMATLWEKDLLT